MKLCVRFWVVSFFLQSNWCFLVFFYLLYWHMERIVLNSLLQKVCTSNSSRSQYFRGFAQCLIVSLILLQRTDAGCIGFMILWIVSRNIRAEHLVPFSPWSGCCFYWDCKYYSTCSWWQRAFLTSVTGLTTSQLHTSVPLKCAKGENRWACPHSEQGTWLDCKITLCFALDDFSSFFS